MLSCCGLEKLMGQVRRRPSSSSDGSVGPDEAILILLRSTPLLQYVPEDTLESISRAVQPVRFAAGEPIVRLNREGNGMLYLIWSGEAKVISPQYDYPSAGHRESRLRCGDYFGIMGPFRQRYKVDVVAINEVLCLVLAYGDADLLSAASVWDWDSKKYGRPKSVEQILQLETVESSTGVMMLESPKFQNYFFKFHYFLEGTNHYRGFKVFTNYFGGQVVAQALDAAAKSVHPEQLVHSLHSYFIHPASADFPVVFQVERIRDGRSYATRHVKAIQKDRLVFVLYSSFKREVDPDYSYEHSAYPMPSVPGPEESIPMEQRLEDYFCDPRLPLDDKKKYAGLKFPLLPIEMRYCYPPDSFHPVKREPRQHIWIRSRVQISGGQNLHRCVGAFASDLPLLGTSTVHHPETVGGTMSLLSLDHTVWFHRSFNAHDWLLLVMECPVTADSHGFTLGRFYTVDGKLVMSVAQEGIVRILDEHKPEHKAEGLAKL